MPCTAGPFKVLQKINDNAYVLDLPAEYGVSSSFNVVDLKSYAGEDEELPSRTTSIQEGGMMRTSTPTKEWLHQLNQHRRHQDHSLELVHVN
jgi:hypothetical protein